jgi:1-deoxy-D-xylulose-5-phosphate reductoisomerase
MPEAESTRTGISVIGSTGSIGTQTLDVLRSLEDRFNVCALAAGTNQDLLAEQAREFRPDLVVTREHPGKGLDLPSGTTSAYGTDGLLQAATHPNAEIVVIASSGHSAIEPTLAAIAAGKTIAIANKEVIVCAGALIMPAAREAGVEVRPIDSEHSAVWQALDGKSQVHRIILTASGGPFRTLPLDELPSVSITDALGHPTWTMGQKVTIDSATMMNKGLELIEARWLFDIPYEQIDVLIHPESIIHSIVEYADGSQIAQLGMPDMRLPIQYALTHPLHERGTADRLRLEDVGALHFFGVEAARYPALDLARQAGIAGDTYPTALSAADEVAVRAFLDERIGFTCIVETVERVLSAHVPKQFSRPIATPETPRMTLF